MYTINDTIEDSSTTLTAIFRETSEQDFDATYAVLDILIQNFNPSNGNINVSRKDAVMFHACLTAHLKSIGAI